MTASPIIEVQDLTKRFAGDLGQVLRAGDRVLLYPKKAEDVVADRDGGIL